MTIALLSDEIKTGRNEMAISPSPRNARGGRSVQKSPAFGHSGLLSGSSSFVNILEVPSSASAESL